MKARHGLVISLVFGLTGILAAQYSTIASAGNEPSNVAYASYQSSSITNTSQALRVWSITITDATGDVLPTEVYILQISGIAPGGITNLAPVIKRARLFSGSTPLDVADVDVNGTFIHFEIPAYVVVPSNGSTTLDLYVTFEATVTDNQNIKFAILDAQSSADALFTSTSSGFGAWTPGTPSSDVSVDKNRIEVTATKLTYVNVPTYVKPATNFSLGVEAQDALGNKDLDATPSATIAVNTGSGIISSGTGLEQALTSGSFSWSDLQLSLEEPAVTLTTTNGSGLTNSTSSIIEVSNALLIEEFSYEQNALLTNNGWTAFGAETATNPQTALGSGLLFTGYASSNKGNAIDLYYGGQDVYKNFTSQTSGSVYLAFMYSGNLVGSSGSPVVSLGVTSPTGTGSLQLVVYAKYSSGLAFGISKNFGFPTWTGFSYSQGPTYLIVAKYTFNGGANDDVAILYVNPTLNGSEPGSPTLMANASGDEADATSLATAALIQDSFSDSIVDGVRVMTQWTPYVLPVQLTNFTASAAGMNATLQWGTATETNNYGFEVERRIVSSQSTVVSSQTEAGTWRKIGFIPGAGTSTSPREYSFTDANVAPGRYAYRIKQVDRDGSYTMYNEAEVEIGLTAKAFVLNDAFPNPFNPTTNIDFSLATAGPASLKVYDLLGREVASLFDASAEAGRLYRATWDAAGMPSGMYFVRLTSGGSAEMKRLMLVK